MAKAPFLLPTAFVGCPYGKKFKFKAFRKTLESLPQARPKPHFGLLFSSKDPETVAGPTKGLKGRKRGSLQ
jgi:hypothetical protein